MKSKLTTFKKKNNVKVLKKKQTAKVTGGRPLSFFNCLNEMEESNSAS